MNNQEYYNPGEYYDAPETGTALVAAPAMGIAPLQPIIINRPDSHYNRSLAVRAEKTVSHEQHRVRIAGEAIVNVAALCQLGDACVQAVPSSREPIGIIVRGHAETVRDRIARW